MNYFSYNAPVVKQIAEACMKACPLALIGITTNPVNCFVPIVSKIFKLGRCYHPNRIFGITTIDTMRASAIVTNQVLAGTRDPGEFLVPVIGGRSPETIVPVLSQTSPCMEIRDDMIECLIDKIRTASSAVVNLKQSQGGPRLSVALEVTRFTNNLIKALKCERDITELAYVYTNQVPGVCYFSTPIELEVRRIRRNLGLIKVDEVLEKPYLKQAIEYLKCDIKMREEYIKDPPDPCKTH